jgi:phosphate-selective porin OprO/OprP
MAQHQPRPSRWPLALLALTAALAAALPASCQDLPGSIAESLAEPDPTDNRLETIERELQKLRDTVATRKAGAPARPTFQMAGLLHIDYLWIGQNAANRATVGDADDVFDFRRARLTARGEAYDVVEYAIGFDFALAGRPSFLDNWINVKDLPILGNLRAGHYFEPFSLERFTLIRYTTFMERSLADTFAPARNLGVMAHNTYGEEENGAWFVGWFRSNSNNFGDDFSDTGGNALTTRLTWLPYYDLDAGGQSFVHLGAGYTYRSADNHELQFQSFPEARAGAPSSTSGIPPFVDTGLISALNDQRLGLEFALVRGPLYIQSEYMCSRVDQIGGPPLFFNGAYAYITYFLTGENHTYNKQSGTLDRVFPFENFFRVRTNDGTQTGMGAWEIAARWSHIDLDSRNIQGGRLSDLTLALNWYLNPYTRVHWEYVYAMLDRAPVGDSFAQTAGMRFDIDF